MGPGLNIWDFVDSQVSIDSALSSLGFSSQDLWGGSGPNH
jgi:hypothetical protein